MKIIGTTDRGFILQADEYEVARLCGYYGPSDCRSRLVVGADVQVNAMFEQLYAIKNIQRNIKEIESNSADLLASIKTKMPIIQPVIDAIEKSTPKAT